MATRPKLAKLSPEAMQARRAYQRAWREKNRIHLRTYHREWAKRNPEKLAAAAARYWENKSRKDNSNEH